MIPENIAIIFLVIPLACFWYIFRGLSAEDNPVWGNLIAAGISATVCALVAIWFFSGTIVSPSIIVNATYQIPADLTTSDMIIQQATASNTINRLGPGGSGMFMRSAVSNGNFLSNQTVITVQTHDIIYQQYQDMGVMFFYLLLCGVSIALFAWFTLELRKMLRERDAAEENPELYGSGEE